MTATAKAPSGRKIWKALRDELTLNLYPLPFSTLAPTVYHVYLHPDDYESIEGVLPKVVSQLQQALTAEVDNINGGLRRSTRRILARFLEREELPPIEIPAGGWEVHVRADRNGELEHGQLGIVSTLALPSPPEYAGTPTTRIVRSVVAGGRRSSATTEAQPADTPALIPAQVVPPGDVAAAPPTASVRATDVRDSRDRARLVYQDDQGPHVFMMRKDTLSVGRGGSSAWVDVQVVASSKVSREHLRLRLDPNGQFYIQDVSLWGTSVDGVTIPPAVKSAEGVAQPGPERPLPARARIALADALEIQFEAIGAP